MKKVLVAVLILIATGAFGQQANGEWLHNDWQVTQRYNNTNVVVDPLAMGQFLGFVFGIALAGNDAQWFAIPGTVDAGQEEAIVGKYLDNHPEEWNLPAQTLVYKAFRAVYPGKKQLP